MDIAKESTNTRDASTAVIDVAEVIVAGPRRRLAVRRGLSVRVQSPDAAAATAICRIVRRRIAKAEAVLLDVVALREI